MHKLRLSLPAVLAVLTIGCPDPKPAVPETFAVGGVVEGLEGAGLVLQNSAGEELAITANGPFTFAQKIAANTELTVTVAQQPTGPAQTCVLEAATRTVTGDISDLSVKCTTRDFVVGGTVTGLQGQGLVLQNNDGDDLPITADGAFTFATAIASGKTFTVSVKSQPEQPTQTCAVSGGSGTIAAGDVTTVTVNCATNAYTIGGTVSGLAGTGLALRNNGGDEIPVSANGTFAFPTPVSSGAGFAVTVATQPSSPSQTCTVSSGDGTVVASNVTTVAVVCTTNTYAVGGTVSGLAGSGLVLQNNLGDDFPVASDGSFSFPTALESGAMYSVTVLTQPTSPAQTCVVADGSGLVTSADVTTVSVVCETNTYAVGGTVTGLQGSGLVLSNGSDLLPISADGTFTFPTPVPSGQTFQVSVDSQPVSPWQTCVVSGGSGTVVSADVTSVTVNCTTNTYAVGGTVSGLAGSGLALSLNGGTPLPVSANGTFAFPDTLPSGDAYTVALIGQPTSPWQTCTIGGDSGTIADSDITSVAVTCTTNSFSVGGTVSGLAGAGLVLRNNGGDDLPIGADGTFVFATPVDSGQTYSVTVATQPTSPWQTCSVQSGAGTMAGGAVTNVSVVCVTNTYAVGGTVSGLAGTVVLQNAGGDDLTVNTNGTFTFATPISSGGTYAIAVKTQPTSPWQTCTVSNGTGTVTDSAITNVTVNCVTNTYTVGGTVTGLAGAGLVLQVNGGDDLGIAANGTFTFPTALASGSNYSVSVLSSPANPTQTCTVTGGTGTIGGSNVSSITVNCVTNTYTVGGTVSGLAGSGLILRNNGGDDLPISGNGSFAFPTAISSGGAYSVTLLTQPSSPSQTCTVTNGTGTISSANVTSVAISCVTNSYAVSVQVSGLSGSGLVLQDNGGDNLAVPNNGTWTFATKVLSGQPYNVTVLTQPAAPSQTCLVAAPTGTMGGAPVTLSVSCTTNAFTVGGTVSGLSGTLVLQNNGADDLTVSANGAFTFATPVASGAPYSVTVKTNPPGKVCTASNASGTIGAGPVTNVSVTCAVAMCDWLAGPVFTDNIAGWDTSGLQFIANVNTTLKGFTFNHQGLSDTIYLTDDFGNVLQTLAVPASSPGATDFSVSWPLTAGQTYRLVDVGPSNGRWVNYSGFPTSNSQISVLGICGKDSGCYTSFWFTFTNLQTCQ